MLEFVRLNRLFLIGTLLFVSLWLWFNVVLALRFSFVSIDSVLYGLPVARVGHGFDLGIPFLHNHDGLGESWGHQWPGTMWLKAIFFRFIPYQLQWDFLLLYVAQAVAALLAGCLLWKVTRSMWSVIAALLLMMSDRILLLCAAGQRPEPLVICCLAVLVTVRFCASGNWRWLGAAAAFFAALSHPVAMVLVLGMTLYWSFEARARGGWKIKNVDCFLLGAGLGCLTLVGWLVVDPMARAQWWQNVQLQRGFYHNWNSVWSGLSNYRFGGGYLMWLLVVFAGCHCAYRRWRGDRVADDNTAAALQQTLLFAWAMFACGHTITRCENFSYIAIGNFFAIGIVVLEARVIKRRWFQQCLACLVVLHVVILPYRCLQYGRAGYPNYSEQLGRWVQQLPQSRAIYFPHVMWPLAINNTAHQWHWWTLPIASTAENRARYEKAAYASVQEGDLLIVDESMMAGEDKFGLQPTFPVVPPDPKKWIFIGEFRSPIAGRQEWGLSLKAYQCVKALPALN